MTDTDIKPEVTSIYEDEDLADRLLKWIGESSPKCVEWRRDEAIPCYAFVAGNQWDDSDVEALRKEGRAPITYDRIGPMVNAVTGAEIGNRKKVRFSPREVNDSPVNENLSEAADWARDQTNAEDEESAAFRDSLISGLGWTETRMDYETNPKGEIRISRVSPLEMGWDVRASEVNLADTRYRWREKEMRREDVEDMIGGEVPESAFTGTVVEPPPITRLDSQDDYGSKGNAYTNTGEAPSDKMVTVRHIQWWEREWRYEVPNPNGKTEAITEEQFQELSAELQRVGMPAPPAQRIKKKICRMVMMVGRTFLAPPVELPCGFTFNGVTGQRDEKNGLWYGLVRAMIDPQRWSNKLLSQTLHIFNSNAKGGLIAELDAFEDTQRAQEDWSKPDSIVWAKPGALGKGKIQPKVAPPIPNALTQLLQFSIQSITDVTGISREMMGIVEHEQSGVLEYQRKQASYALLASYFDALRRYRKEQGHVLLYFLKYIGDGRLIRILGEDQAKYVPFMFDPDVMEYDVIVDDAPAGPNQKETTWRMITDLLPLLTKANLPQEAWLEIFKYSPVPTPLMAKLREIMQSAAENNEGQQMQQQMIQFQMADLAAKIQKTQADAALSQAKAMEAGGSGFYEDPQKVQQAQHAMERDAMETERMQEEAGQRRAEAPPPGHHEFLHEQAQEQAAATTAKAKNDAALALLAGIEKLKTAAAQRKAKKETSDE